jgi:hypothetical protein
MAGPTDWVSFSDYLDLNKDEMQAAVAQAQAGASQYDDDQEAALRQAGHEAGRTGTPMQQTASYGQFLKARDQAKEAMAKARQGLSTSMEEDALLEALGLKVTEYDASGLANQVRASAKEQYGRQLTANEMQEKADRDAALAREAQDEKARQARGGISQEDYDRNLRIERMIEGAGRGQLTEDGQPVMGSELWKIYNQVGHPDHEALVARLKYQKFGREGGYDETARYHGGGQTAADIANINKRASAAYRQYDPYWEGRKSAADKQYKEKQKANEGWQSEAAKKRQAWESAWSQDDATWEY